MDSTLVAQSHLDVDANLAVVDHVVDRLLSLDVVEVVVCVLFDVYLLLLWLDVDDVLAMFVIGF